MDLSKLSPKSSEKSGNKATSYKATTNPSISSSSQKSYPSASSFEKTTAESPLLEDGELDLLIELSTRVELLEATNSCLHTRISTDRSWKMLRSSSFHVQDLDKHFEDGRIDGFNLFREYMKTIQPHGHWDEIEMTQAMDGPDHSD